MSRIDNVTTRMYRMGTGDFFLLTFFNKKTAKFRMLIDCGCINVANAVIAEHVQDLIDHLNGKPINLLIVTHEHADHINGFEKGAALFDQIVFEKVWFAWTESRTDGFANELRGFNATVNLAIHQATTKLRAALTDDNFRQQLQGEYKGHLMLNSMEMHVRALEEVDALNISLGAGAIPTMEDKLREYNVIKDGTEVDFFNPGDVIENVEGLTGVRFFVLGPPKDKTYLNLAERHGESFEKREEPSAFNLAFMDAVSPAKTSNPFRQSFVSTEATTRAPYEDINESWRRIDFDWLMSVSTLALRYERNINNTSLALAMQFVESGKVFLFPGDAEFGSWLSWHEELGWEFMKDGSKVKVTVEDLLNNTVLYKVSHHSSQNGTPDKKGIQMLTHTDLTALVTLDLDKIQKVWRNTMPNDFIGSELVRRTKGKIYFVGQDCDRILSNIQTDRVTVNKNYVTKAKALNAKFAGSKFIECNIKV